VKLKTVIPKKNIISWTVTADCRVCGQPWWSSRRLPGVPCECAVRCGSELILMDNSAGSRWWAVR